MTFASISLFVKASQTDMSNSLNAAIGSLRSDSQANFLLASKALEVENGCTDLLNGLRISQWTVAKTMKKVAEKVKDAVKPNGTMDRFYKCYFLVFSRVRKIQKKS